MNSWNGTQGRVPLSERLSFIAFSSSAFVVPDRHGKTEEVGGAFPRRSISASSGTGLVTGLARRELRNRAHRERSRIRFESGSLTTFRRGRVPVRRFHSTAPSIPILNHSYAAFKQMTASSGPTSLEWRVSRLRRNAIPLPRFDVSRRLRFTLTASQTFGSAYFFVRLVENLSDSHGSSFSGSLLIAYKRFRNGNR